jgi:hypothetical protein
MSPRMALQEQNISALRASREPCRVPCRPRPNAPAYGLPPARWFSGEASRTGAVSAGHAIMPEDEGIAVDDSLTMRD